MKFLLILLCLNAWTAEYPTTIPAVGTPTLQPAPKAVKPTDYVPPVPKSKEIRMPTAPPVPPTTPTTPPMPPAVSPTPTTPATQTKNLLPSGMPMADVCYPLSKLVFSNLMRTLWEDHIMWTRLYLIAAQANLPDKGDTLRRLLSNQKDLGYSIAPYYGNEAAKALYDLLSEHILIAGRIIDDLLTNKNPDANLTAWNKNGEDIAIFLSKANPNWPLGEMKAMMREHLETTKNEVVAHTSKNWMGSIRAYDIAHDMILKMADHLSMGIFKQFPDKFLK